MQCHDVSPLTHHIGHLVTQSVDELLVRGLQVDLSVCPQNRLPLAAEGRGRGAGVDNDPGDVSSRLVGTPLLFGSDNVESAVRGLFWAVDCSSLGYT